MTQIVPAQILDEIYAQQGTDILLVARYHGGEQGAYALADSTGQRFVLKVNVQLDWIEAARVATDTLRAFNYPAPRYLYGGSSPSGTYAVMTTLPGTPRSSISVHLLPRLLELNALQRGRGAADVVYPENWTSPYVKEAESFKGSEKRIQTDGNDTTPAQQ